MKTENKILAAALTGIIVAEAIRRGPEPVTKFTYVLVGLLVLVFVFGVYSLSQY